MPGSRKGEWGHSIAGSQQGAEGHSSRGNALPRGAVPGHPHRCHQPVLLTARSKLGYESELGYTQRPSGEQQEPAPGLKTRLGHMSRAHPGDRAGDKLPAMSLQAPSRKNKSGSWERKEEGWEWHGPGLSLSGAPGPLGRGMGRGPRWGCSGPLRSTGVPRALAVTPACPTLTEIYGMCLVACHLEYSCHTLKDSGDMGT